MNFIEMYNNLIENKSKVFVNTLTGGIYFFDDYWQDIRVRQFGVITQVTMTHNTVNGIYREEE